MYKRLKGLPNDDDAEGLTRLELIEALEIEDPSGDYSDAMMKASGSMLFDKDTLLTIISEMNYDQKVIDDKD